MAWTKEQQAAIDSRGQTLLLSAAAGSGKTAVLVERIIRRLLDTKNAIDITELLVVTFTKAAAAEMRERVAAALAEELAKNGDSNVERQLALLPSAHISTLHSFCQDVIRRYFYTIDIDPAFTIAGEEELGLLRKTVLERVFLAYYEDETKATFLYPLADMFGNDRGDDALMDMVSKMYTYARSMPWPEEWLRRSAKAYGVDENAVMDDFPWCAPVKADIKRKVKEQVQLYSRIIAEMQERPTFAEACEDFIVERDAMETVLRRDTWESLGRAVTTIEFPRAKPMKKLSPEDKVFWDRCKDTRNACKKLITKQVQETYFSATAAEWLQGIREMAPMMDGLVRLTLDFAEAYRLAKKEKGWIDFSDLEHLCLQILLDKTSTIEHPVPSAAALELRDTFAEVLIDEYQDTNSVQELITRLVSSENNRFMVGDIKQSIYRFRLADPTLFLSKYKTYSRDETAGERCIDLARNFRSAPNILEAVNEVFARAMTEEAAGMGYGEREQLYAGRTAPTESEWVGGPIEIHVVNTKSDTEGMGDDGSDDENAQDLSAFEKECCVIAERIQALKEQQPLIAKKDGSMEPLTYRHIVILMRSMTGKAEVLLRILQGAGIPAYAEQNGGYFAAIEVQIMLSLLQCIDNPEQDLAMAAILRSPMVGLSENDLALLRTSGGDSLWQLLPAYAECVEEREKKERIQQFYSSLTHWRSYSRRHSVGELLQLLYQETGYYDYVGGMPGGMIRQANLKALYDRAGQYEQIGFRGLFRYLRLIEKMKDDGVDLAPAKVLSEREDVVRIMSIHKSKGLEFPVVIVADMGKSFNKQDMKNSLLFHNDLGIGIKQYDSTWRMLYPTMIWNGIRSTLLWEGTAEEERILYVAMTRARDKLILTGHTSKMDTAWQRWASDIPPVQGNSYFDWVMPLVATQKLEDAVVGAMAVGESTEWQSGLWQVKLWQQIPKLVLTEETIIAEPRLAAIQRGELTNTPIPLWMEKQLTWSYPYPKATTTTAKYSVSEIKRQYSMLQETLLGDERALAMPLGEGTTERDDVFEQMPPWLEEEQEVITGAKRGTVLHKAMEYLELTPQMTRQSIQTQLAQWEADGIFTADEARLVYIPAIVQFCQSPLGKQLSQAIDIRREYPFSVVLSGGDYLPDMEEGEGILVQGVIDCLFQNERGEWILVDYKTDRLDDEAAFSKRYAVQLALYKRAIEQISSITLEAVYIYSFYLQKEIKMCS